MKSKKIPPNIWEQVKNKEILFCIHSNYLQRPKHCAIMLISSMIFLIITYLIYAQKQWDNITTILVGLGMTVFIWGLVNLLSKRTIIGTEKALLIFQHGEKHTYPWDELTGNITIMLGKKYMYIELLKPTKWGGHLTAHIIFISNIPYIIHIEKTIQKQITSEHKHHSENH